MSEPVIEIVNVLSIAGADPTGGAGIQADLKAIAANGGYGMAAVTALVAQNTCGVRDVHVPPTDFLAAQLAAVSDDVRIDAVKVGMLGTPEVITTVAEWLERTRPPVVVIDPVMVAASGDRLLGAEAEAALQRILPLADLITPNLPELAVIAGAPVAETWDAMLEQAGAVAAQHGVRVLAKGGHLAGPSSPDALVDPSGGVVAFAGARIATGNSHGTGCSLSSAVATRIARGADWATGVGAARAWLRESLQASDALDVGQGSGPLHHFAGLWSRGAVDGAGGTASDIRAEWWDGIAEVRAATDALPFITRLADGSLPREAFLAYVAQDSLYLGEYARVLARLSTLAPDPAAQRFWLHAAQGALIGELELHRDRLDGAPIGAPSPTTTGYTNHLVASCSDEYAVAAAAALPCFWMYSDIGTRLFRGELGERACDPEHPYAEWIAAYDDAAFAADTESAIALVTELAAAARPDLRERMWGAFRISAEWEHDFFRQTAVDGAGSARSADREHLVPVS
ncbi:hypothetical protein GCM10009847_06950 [Leucobacter tardus]|uniref:bifunctional hydroxymethylpyrimidine kinase/phosphomethylpyrimidine kinase n=1 Tax=Leucobacter tardus TaxID=501483 RepID=UPI001FB9A511|nr:bifunctional hydroxymethylpyrimidine kinase/phosphomethylpyrimidine kinase [Leucobacter tardus]